MPDRIKCEYSDKCKDFNSHLCGSCMNNEFRSYYRAERDYYTYIPYPWNTGGTTGDPTPPFTVVYYSNPIDLTSNNTVSYYAQVS